MCTQNRTGESSKPTKKKKENNERKKRREITIRHFTPKILLMRVFPLPNIIRENMESYPSIYIHL